MSTLLPTPSGTPGLPDDPDMADRNCRLLGPFALFVQTIMGVVVVGMLVLKRQREKPKRPWKIWTLDISKQMLGQLFVHILNVVLSSLGSIASEGENNPCSLYFLNIAIDTTLGVLFIYFSMRYFTHYFTDVLGWPGFVSGQYTTVPSVLGRRRRGRRPTESSFDEPQSPGGDRRDRQDPSLASQASITTPSSSSGAKRQTPRLSFFFRQLSLYLLSLLLMKVLVVILLAVLPFLFDVGRWVLNLFGERQRAQIFFVMAAFPLAMNTLQFWLIDSLLRHNPLTSIYRSEEEAEAVVNGSAGDTPYRQSRASETGSEDVERDSGNRASWWERNQRRQTEDSQRHLVGDLSDSDDGEDHAYPPPRSTSSSIAQLDRHKSFPVGEPVDGGAAGRAEQANGNGNSTSDYGATLGSPPLRPQTGILEGLHTQLGHEPSKDGKGAANEDDDAWDNWDEDRDNRSARKADKVD